MSNRRKFSDYEKKTVYAKCNGKCAICGKPVKFKKMTIDHIKPLSQGGTNDFSNLQLACHSCNRLKNNFTEEEFYDLVERVLRHHRWNSFKEMIIGGNSYEQI